jgi:hypothetical protein
MNVFVGPQRLISRNGQIEPPSRRQLAQEPDEELGVFLDVF